MKKMTPNLKATMKDSFKESVRFGENKIKPEHLLLSILNFDDNQVIEVLEAMGSDVDDLMEKYKKP